MMEGSLIGAKDGDSCCLRCRGPPALARLILPPIVGGLRSLDTGPGTDSHTASPDYFVCYCLLSEIAALLILPTLHVSTEAAKSVTLQSTRLTSAFLLFRVCFLGVVLSEIE